MKLLSTLKRAGRKVAVKVIGGAALGGFIVDSLIRAGLPGDTAGEVGDGLQALLVYFAESF
jgi:hypothetical protein